MIEDPKQPDESKQEGIPSVDALSREKAGYNPPPAEQDLAPEATPEPPPPPPPPPPTPLAPPEQDPAPGATPEPPPPQPDDKE